MKEWKRLYSKDLQNLKNSGYSERAIDHFLNPRNMGTIKDADAIVVAGDPECGDFLEISIKVEPKTHRLADVKFRSFSHDSVSIMASAITEIAKGKTIKEAASITEADLLMYLGEVPDDRKNCSHLAVAALQAAIKRYIEEKEGSQNKKGADDDSKVDSVSSS